MVLTGLKQKINLKDCLIWTVFYFGNMALYSDIILFCMYIMKALGIN